MGKEVSKEQYIEWQQSKIEACRNEIVKNSAMLSFSRMQTLSSNITHYQKLIGYAKSGNMAHFFINEKNGTV